MIFPVQDAFWMETATFVRNAIGQDTPFIGPREFRPVLARVFPYDWVHAVEILAQFGGVVVHKGLMHELPLPVLQAMRKEWKCVFANEVFIFFMPADSALPAASETHLQIFYDRLQSMERLARLQHPKIKELTAFLVVASHAPSFLDKTLHSLSLLHMPVLVVAATPDTARKEAYRSVCSIHHARMEESEKSMTGTRALKRGVRRLLKEDDLAWICSFDDAMVARPDFLLVMEKFRDSETYPLLGGLWTEADGMRASFSRDGFQLLIPQRQTSLHLYGHREYWRRRFFSADTSLRHVLFNWRKFPLIPRRTQSLVIRDLVSLQASV